MALADLGGLGDKEGPALGYHWVPPSRIPPLVPWLAVLMMLAARHNRRVRAWWILVPLSVVAGLGTLLQIGSDSLPASEFNSFFELVLALAFGVGAVWLLSPWLRRSHRVLTFLLTLLVFAGCSTLTLFARRELDADMEQGCGEAVGVLLAAFVASLALSLAGLLCRRRYSRVRFLLWLVIFTLAAWVMVACPFWLVALAGGQGAPTVWIFLGVALAATGISLGMLLPFLVLSFANGFYHERLKEWLHTGQLAAPPVIGPVEPVAATART